MVNGPDEPLLRTGCLSVLKSQDDHLQSNRQDDPDNGPHNAEYENPLGFAGVIVLEHEKAYEAAHPGQE